MQSEATGQAVGLCLEAHDLAISKYVAGREKDLSFTLELARHGMTRRSVLLERLKITALPDLIRDLVRQQNFPQEAYEQSLQTSRGRRLRTSRRETAPSSRSLASVIGSARKL